MRRLLGANQRYKMQLSIVRANGQLDPRSTVHTYHCPNQSHYAFTLQVTTTTTTTHFQSRWWQEDEFNQSIDHMPGLHRDRCGNKEPTKFVDKSKKNCNKNIFKVRFKNAFEVSC